MSRTHLTISLGIVILLFVIGFGFVKGTNQQLSQIAELSSDRPSDVKRNSVSGLPNLCSPREGIYSGGQPEGERGFSQLSEMGIKTIISVDGARPQVELAGKFGLSYVHLPHGYDGIESAHAIKLAKAVQSLEGPVYIHCHHGKHRSPAAAAIVCVSLNQMTSEEGVGFLREAGTSPQYGGLYESVARSKPLSLTILDQSRFVFTSVAPATPVVQSMVAIEKHFDSLSALIERNGIATQQEPDLVAAHEALILFEHFTELHREEGPSEPGYQKLMNSAREHSEQISELLFDAKNKAFPKDQAKRLIDAIGEDCRVCHQRFRD